MSLLIDTDCVTQHVDQHVVIDRLFQKIDGAVFQRGPRGRDVSEGGQHHHRQRDVPLIQHRLQVEAVHSRHLQVGQQAAAPLGRIGLQEILGRREHRRAQPFQGDQQAEGVADRGIVIYNKHGGVSHMASFWLRRRKRQ